MPLPSWLNNVVVPEAADVGPYFEGTPKSKDVAKAATVPVIKSGKAKLKKDPPKPEKKADKTTAAKDPDVKQTEAPTTEYWFPGTEYHHGRVTIKISGYKWLNLAAISRQRIDGFNNSKPLTKDPSWNKYILNFIAPNEIQEPLSHSWEPYQSMASRIGDKASLVNKGLAELKGIRDKLSTKDLKDAIMALSRKDYKGANDIITKATGGSFLAALSKAAEVGMGRELVSTNRVDSPLVYKNTSRRVYDFVFNVFASTPDRAYAEVVFPVRLLQFLSTPGLPISGDSKEKKPTITEITPPYIFTIESSSVSDYNFINVDSMVLKNIQATYRGPYIDIYPSSAELHLTFEELDPTWDRSFFPDSNRVVTTYDMAKNYKTDIYHNYSQ